MDSYITVCIEINCRRKIKLKILEENTGQYFYDLRVRKEFLNKIQEVQIKKENLIYFTILKEEKTLLYIERHKQMKRQATWSNYFGIILQFMWRLYHPAILPLVMSWRNSCTWESREMHNNVYCIFIIAKNWK